MLNIQLETLGSSQADLWSLESILSSFEKAAFCLSECFDCLGVVLECRAVPK